MVSNSLSGNQVISNPEIALFDSELALSPSLTEYVIPPQVTDSEINDLFNPHYVVIDESTTPQNQLLLFLSGSRGQPLNQQLFTQEAAELGYHAINLSYANPAAVKNLCRSSTDPNCHENVRLEILDGVDRTEEIDVSPANSIENQLLSLLLYLEQEYPEQGWSEYTEGESLQWESMVVAGHSMGGGQALMIAREYEVARVVMLSQETDTVSGNIAPWLSEPRATPTDRYFGFAHLEEARYEIKKQTWELLGLNTYGDVVNIDSETPPYNYSHQLVTSAPPAIRGKYHGSVANDRTTPRNADGTLLFEDAWRHLLSTPLVPPDLAGDSLETARELGFLDATPVEQTFVETLGEEDEGDYYRFKLQATSNFELNLEGLQANADVFVLDSQSNIVASSVNEGNISEAITSILDPGDYYILVEPADANAAPFTPYELTLQAQFQRVVAEENMNGLRAPDIEYDHIGFQAAWQDQERNLWVAPIDQQTGEILFTQAEQIDSGLALNAPISSGIATGNGPEWVYTEAGSQILYTLQIGPDGPQSWFVGRAQNTESGWQAGLLPPGMLPGGAPNGTSIESDSSPFIKYITRDELGRRTLVWHQLDNPEIGGTLLAQGFEGARWVPEEYAFVTTQGDRGEVNQILKADIDPQTGELEFTQLTNNTDTVKDKPRMWRAPEYDNELVILAQESDPQTRNQITSMGVYRQLEGAQNYSRIATITSPSPDQPFIDVADVFVYNGRSYVLFSTLPTPDSRGGEVWIAGIDQELPFYRQLSDPNAEKPFNDPEYLITDSGVVVYFSQSRGRQIFRAETGLGLPNIAPTPDNPIPDQSATIDNLFEFTFAADTFEDADGDSLTYSATLEDESPLPSWLSFEHETLTFRGTPVAEDIGSLNITVQADDSRGGIANDTFEIAVTDTPSVNQDVDNVFPITDAGLDLISLPGEQVRVSLQVSSDTNFRNLGGLYRLANEEGGVIDPATGELIMPGNTDYTQAALSNQVLEFDATGISSTTLLGGFIYAPYILADGESAYFPFIDANADGIDHVRLLSDNIFAFEDMFGGGDFSYDDFVVEVELI